MIIMFIIKFNNYYYGCRRSFAFLNLHNIWVVAYFNSVSFETPVVYFSNNFSNPFSFETIDIIFSVCLL